MLHGRDDVRRVMSCAWLYPDIALCIQAKVFYLIKPQNILPYTLSLSHAFLQTHGVLSCNFLRSGFCLATQKAQISEVL
jgi:hypothetical protein